MKYIGLVVEKSPNEEVLRYLSTLCAGLGRYPLLIAAQKGVSVQYLAEAEQVYAPLWEDMGVVNELLEKRDISFLVFDIADLTLSLRKSLLKLQALRLPYLFLPSPMPTGLSCPQQFVLPIRVYPEDKELGVFASPLSKKFGARVDLLVARAYGSRAADMGDTLFAFFTDQEIPVTKKQGVKRSDKLAKEALHLLSSEMEGWLLMSASRSYGWDDILLGPSEWHVLKKSHVPVMLINPREDLYLLCD